MSMQMDISMAGRFTRSLSLAPATGGMKQILMDRVDHNPTVLVAARVMARKVARAMAPVVVKAMAQEAVIHMVLVVERIHRILGRLLTEDQW